MDPNVLGHVGGFRAGRSSNAAFNDAYRIACKACGCTEGWLAYTNPPIVVCSECSTPAMGDGY